MGAANRSSGGGKRIGVTICEDVWTEDYLRRPFYDRDPVEELSAAGVDLLINLSASPYHLGKPENRRRMLTDVAKEANVPIVYCNSIGGNDQLVFDGHSMAVDPSGEVISQLSGFVEESRVIEVFSGGETEPLKSGSTEQLYDALVLGLRGLRAQVWVFHCLSRPQWRD